MSETMAPAAAIKFLEEMATYWAKQPDGGEDLAHWAHVYNAENCRKIAGLIKATHEPVTSTFPPVGYRLLGAGIRCRCPKMFVDGNGTAWCCRS